MPFFSQSYVGASTIFMTKDKVLIDGSHQNSSNRFEYYQLRKRGTRPTKTLRTTSLSYDDLTYSNFQGFGFDSHCHKARSISPRFDIHMVRKS